MPTDTLKTTIDAHTNSAAPSTNYGLQEFLALKGVGVEFGFIWFPLPIPAGATIESAALKVYLHGAWAGGPHTVTAKRITTTWAEDSITHVSQPTVTAANSATDAITGGADEALLEFDVTDMVADASAGWFGIRLELDTTNELKLFSSEGAVTASFDTGPVLEVTYHSPPEAPSSLRPTGGRAESLTDPVLAWAYSSVEGQTQAESKVQIDNNSDMSSPLYDPGYVANTVTQITADANLSDNTTYYWRVRVKDVQGSESPWSEVAEFQRRTHGALTITSPAADNDDVASVTPVFTHTFIGRTQRMVQHTLFRRATAADPWVEFYSDSPGTTAATAWELPAAFALDSTSDDFKYRLRVWDTFDRESLPGDTAYVEASRIFQYAPTATVDPVTDLDGVSSDFAVVLTWERAAAPDYFHVLVDGVVAKAFIDPLDVFVAGTAYLYTYKGVTPWEEHEYSVVAVEISGGEAKSSSPNPTVDVKTRPVGIWLVAPDNDIEVVILGRDPGNVNLGETSVILYPEAARIPVKIQGVVRGYEGTVSGILSSYKGVAARTWMSRLKALKDLPPSANIRLVFGHRNFPVMLGRASMNELPSPDESYDVAVEFYQVGEFD